MLADDPGQLLAHPGTQRPGTGSSPTLDYQLGNLLEEKMDVLLDVKWTL